MTPPLPTANAWFASVPATAFKSSVVPEVIATKPDPFAAQDEAVTSAAKIVSSGAAHMPKSSVVVPVA